MSRDEAEKTFWVTSVSSVLFVVFGTYLLFKPNITITIISRCLSIIIAAIGVFGLYKYITRKKKEKKVDINLIYSIISFVIALFIFLKPNAISGLIPIALGIYMVVNLILKMGYLKELKKQTKKDLGVCIFTFIIMFLFGVFIIINPLKNVLNSNQSIGIFITFYSILDIILCYLFKNNID
jgi:uncharacterized membrane protein HdeD (DUF308 family)